MMCGECNFPTMAVKYQTYTPETMREYVDAPYKADPPGKWKREEGCIQGADLPWISFELVGENWMHLWQLEEDGRLTKSQFNPNQEFNIVVK